MAQSSQSPAYLTTPIYYVNDRPHIGHCYSTVVADVAARYARLIGGTSRPVFFLTGTDEHAEKVVETARQRGLTPLQWADLNAAEFAKAFELFGCSHDDFIRTTQDRHKNKVQQYITQLQEKGDIYQGDYTGWFDPSQEEYLTESTAKEHNYTSPVTGKPLVKRTEKNYFFRLSRFEAALKQHIEQNPGFIRPEARRNEVLGRLREGLSDVPISRAVVAGDEASAWGILMPSDPGHRIYVWIDALFNYLSTVDTPERRQFWPPKVHVLAKDILWFHAVIWPCMLMALGQSLPHCVYAHAYWVREGRKMSKSLGNFVDLEVIHKYIAAYSRDAFRYYLIAQGPQDATDADFAHTKFIEVYNSDLANGIGNATSRVGNMIDKYFGGILPDAKGITKLDDQPAFDWPAITKAAVTSAIAKVEVMDLSGALAEGLGLVRKVDSYINATEPFKLAKKIPAGDSSNQSPESQRLAAILSHCAEALRVASLLLSPALPAKMAALLETWSCTPDTSLPLLTLADWHGPSSLKPGQKVSKGEVLFMRAEGSEITP